jgi:pyruvate dehydrogenase E2 component (dihydrolipoamide acetyltransferase)
VLYEFKFPDVGEGITEGEIVKWHVQVGQQVEEDQLIAEVQTDKAVVEITTPVTGVVKQIPYAEGAVVPVEAVMISFEVAGQKNGPSAASSSTDVAPATNATTDSNTSTAPAVPSIVSNNTVIAVPTVRRLARELQVDLSVITGTGKNGRITEEDVHRFIARKNEQPDQPQAPAPAQLPIYSSMNEVATSTTLIEAATLPAEQRIPLRGIRRAISQSMNRSVRTAAHSTIVEEVDVTQLMAIRKQMAPSAADKGVNLTYLSFFIKSAVSSLKAFPYLNAAIDDEREEIVLKNEYNIGVAVDTPNGLMVPVIKSADQKNLLVLAKEIGEVAELTRHQKLPMERMKGSTFTITNIGSTGVGLSGTPIINYPEVAILAMHRIQKKPVVNEQDEIVVRSMMGLSLSFDHRLIDGAMASYFLKSVMNYIENPNLLFMEMV